MSKEKVIKVKVNADKPMGKQFVIDVEKCGELLKRHSFKAITFTRKDT